MQTLRTDAEIAVAPMMDWTDRHCRYFLRLLSPRARLYTEMVTAAAIHHGDKDRLLAYNDSEHPIALQLGGSDPRLMAAAARDAAVYAYDEININVGCPSDRVQSGQFGACLMATPEVVADCFRAMQAATDIPVTVKSRIGIDDHDDEAFLQRFVDTLAAAGCKKFVVHARIAILQGLSPKQNRSVPPLNYERVYRLKERLPELDIVVNGGITTLRQLDEGLQRCDGVMIGRQAYQQPYFLAEIERHLDPSWVPPSRHEIVTRMLPYAQAVLDNGEPVSRITRHMMGLFAGQSGARAWRRYISEHACRPGAGVEVLVNALNQMPTAA